MSKRTFTLKLSITGKNEQDAARFLDDLEEIVEKASANGLEVSVQSNGSEVAVWTDYSREIYIAENEIDPGLLPHVQGFIRPEGVCDGIFVYRKDSIAVLRLRVFPETHPGLFEPTFS